MTGGLRQGEERGVEQIEFEDKGLRQMYEDECARNGVTAQM